MIGESICLGRDGIHFDLFIKVGRLNVTLSPAHRGPINPMYLQKGSASITHGWHCHSSPFKRRGPRAPPFFYFFFKHV